nr:MAG TPA: hypothetical protein [Caudoviricetes sp.]
MMLMMQWQILERQKIVSLNSIRQGKLLYLIINPNGNR